jgi:hypothetical protein
MTPSRARWTARSGSNRTGYPGRQAHGGSFVLEARRRRGLVAKQASDTTRASDLVLASCEPSDLVDTPVLVTVDPKHPLFFDGAYEPPPVGATDRRPRFRATRGLLAKSDFAPSFAKLRAGGTRSGWAARMTR